MWAAVSRCLFGVVVASLFLPGLRPGRGPSVRFRLEGKTKRSESDWIIGKESGRKTSCRDPGWVNLAGGTLGFIKLRTGRLVV